MTPPREQVPGPFSGPRVPGVLLRTDSVPPPRQEGLRVIPSLCGDPGRSRTSRSPRLLVALLVGMVKPNVARNKGHRRISAFGHRESGGIGSLPGTGKPRGHSIPRGSLSSGLTNESRPPLPTDRAGSTPRRRRIQFRSPVQDTGHSVCKTHRPLKGRNSVGPSRGAGILTPSSALSGREVSEGRTPGTTAPTPSAGGQAEV